MSDDQRLEALERAVAALSARLEAVAAARPLQGTMKETLRCASCGGGCIVHAERVLDRDGGSSSEMAMVQTWTTRGFGKMEAYVCAACGRCEWWVRDVDELVQHVAAKAHDHLRILEAPGGEGPYR